MALSAEKRFERVMDRLAYCKEVYKDHGILGNDQVMHTDMLFLMRMYAGEGQWSRIDGWGNLDREDQVTVNKVFALSNQFEAEAAARPPEVQVIPRGKTLTNLERSASAGVIQALINYDIEELEFEEQTLEAFDDNLFAPFGAVRHMFTPREEHSTQTGKRLSWFRHEKPDKPFIRRYAPWDVLLDPSAARFTPDGGMRFCFFRDLYTIEQIRENPHMKLRDDVRKMAGAFRGRDGERPTPTQLRRMKKKDPDDATIVEVWTYYDAEDRSWMQVVEDGVSKPIRDEEEWPLDWEWLPVSVFVANRKRNSPFGVPMLGPVATLQEELNKVRSMMSWLARAIRRLVGVDVSRMDPAEIAKLESAALTEILKVNGPLTEIVQNLQAGSLPQELLIYSQQIESDMREELGLSLPGRGQRINVETATEAGNVQQGQDVNIGRVVRKYEKFWLHIVKTYMQARRQTMQLTGPEVVTLLGTDADGALNTATVDPSTLHGEFDFQVVPGSTRRRDPMVEERLAMGRLELAKQHPDLLQTSFYANRLVHAQRFDPRDALTAFNRTASQTQGLRDVADNAREAQGVTPPTQTPPSPSILDFVRNG